ncbi:MAG: hypothetical protein ACOYPR_03200 [Saprospiraceae bacterium]
MKITTKESYYKRRRANVRKIDDAITLLELQIKTCIRNLETCSNNGEKIKIENEIELFTNLLSGAVIIWCETLIKALFYEYGAFKEEQINELLDKKRSLEQKWTLALSCVFFKAFSGQSYNPAMPITNKNTILTLSSIPQSEKDKFAKLYDMIENRLCPAIKIRNKIQHGDWAFSFQEAEFQKNLTTGLRTLAKRPAYDRHTTEKVEQENILTLRLKRQQFRIIYGLIKNLAVFRRIGKYRVDANSTPFQDNFGKKYKQILANQKLLETADYEKYKIDLISSTSRGKIWAKKNKNIFIRIKTWLTDNFLKLFKI